ncbi:MAG: hypothetical protein LBI60_03070 [Bacteroidales bacterium]|jgi:hypothetical protein|nr:hypothetical protein [Bacteroidales bacterium]
MKSWKISVIWLFFAGTIFMACDKYDSKISGKANYIDKNNNTSYPASGAVITKMTLKGDSLYPVVAVVADGNGEFLFEHTTKGSWRLSGKLEKDSIFYFGFSEDFTTNGNNHIEQTILLEPPINEDDSE